MDDKRGINFSEQYLTDCFDTYYRTRIEAAEQGNSEAQYALGDCFIKGEGVERDFTQAVYWFRKAAEQDYAKAQYALGVCYEFGYGIVQDKTQAEYWYQKAAKQGYGRSDEAGQEVNKDNNTQALYWYMEARKHGCGFSKENIDALKKIYDEKSDSENTHR